jgi:glucose-6-phosphate isomerase
VADTLSDVGFDWWPQQRVVAVGLLPAALLNIDGFLAGTAEVNKLTVNCNVKANLQVLLSLAWFE